MKNLRCCVVLNRSLGDVIPIYVSVGGLLKIKINNFLDILLS